MSKILVQISHPRYVELDPEIEDICLECGGEGQAPTMHILIGNPPMGTCYSCNGTGVTAKKLPELPPEKHACEMAPGGTPCEEPGKVHHDGHWLCKGHMDNVIKFKTEKVIEEIAQLRAMKKQCRDAGM